MHSAETVEFRSGFKLLRLALWFHIFSCRYRVNAAPKRKNFVPFSNSPGIVWTGLYIITSLYVLLNEFAFQSRIYTGFDPAQHDSHGQYDWRAKGRSPIEKNSLSLNIRERKRQNWNPILRNVVPEANWGKLCNKIKYEFNHLVTLFSKSCRSYLQIWPLRL